MPGQVGGVTVIVVMGPGCLRPLPSAFVKTKDKGGGEGNHDGYVYEGWIMIPNCNPSCNQRSLLDTTEIVPLFRVISGCGRIGRISRTMATLETGQDPPYEASEHREDTSQHHEDTSQCRRETLQRRRETSQLVGTRRNL